MEVSELQLDLLKFEFLPKLYSFCYFGRQQELLFHFLSDLIFRQPVVPPQIALLLLPWLEGQ